MAQDQYKELSHKKKKLKKGTQEFVTKVWLKKRRKNKGTWKIIQEN